MILEHTGASTLYITCIKAYTLDDQPESILKEDSQYKIPKGCTLTIHSAKCGSPVAQPLP